MSWMNKRFISALAVAIVITKSQCLSFSMSQSQRRCCHPHRNRQSMKSCRTVAPCCMIHTTDGGGEVEEPVRRRWRRRRKNDDSTSLIGSIDDSRVTDSDDDDINTRDYEEQELASTTIATTSTTSQCPIYSMKFPRYRISLTNDSSKNLESEQRRNRRLRRGLITKLLVPQSYGGGGGNDAKNRGNGNNNHSLGLLVNLLRAWNSDDLLDPSSKNDRRLRKSVEAFYHEERMQGRFRWITSSSSSDGSSSGSSIAESSSMNAPDEDFHAAAAFWRMASDIIANLATDDDSDDHHQQKIWYLALPETTSTIAQNLCDTLNWYADYAMEHHLKDGGEELSILLLHAEMDTRASNDGKIPIVRFNLHNQVPLQDKQRQLARFQHQHQQKLLLPTSNDTERRTKAWVKRVLVQYGICPFTKSDSKSGQGLRDLGVPVANIMYRHSSAMGGGGSGSSEDGYLLMADAWEAISDMVAAGPTGVSSILLSAPGFDDDFDFWAGPIFAMLETCVGAIQAEEMIGVVCFHPMYVTPDGKSWPGFGHMHSVPRLKQWYTQYVTTDEESPSTPQSLSDNEIAAGGAWQRRTPHSVINVLRAEQLEAAEGRRRTGELYGRNIRVLVGSEGGVGLEKLTEDLKREQCM